jgi:hypothetical protein
MAEKKKHDEVCPNCGHCPTCGRSAQPYITYPSIPYPWSQPPSWSYPYGQPIAVTYTGTTGFISGTTTTTSNQ